MPSPTNAPASAPTCLLVSGHRRMRNEPAPALRAALSTSSPSKVHPEGCPPATPRSGAGAQGWTILRKHRRVNSGERRSLVGRSDLARARRSGARAFPLYNSAYTLAELPPCARSSRDEARGVPALETGPLKTQGKHSSPAHEWRGLDADPRIAASYLEPCGYRNIAPVPSEARAKQVPRAALGAMLAARGAASGEAPDSRLAVSSRRREPEPCGESRRRMDEWLDGRRHVAPDGDRRPGDGAAARRDR